MARVLVLTLDGREYRASDESLANLTIKEARAIKHRTGLRIAGWAQALDNLDDVDPDAFLGLVYLMKTRAGEVFDWSSFDDVPLFDFVGLFKSESETVPDPEGDDDSVELDIRSEVVT